MAAAIAFCLLMIIACVIRPVTLMDGLAISRTHLDCVRRQGIPWRHCTGPNKRMLFIQTYVIFPIGFGRGVVSRRRRSLLDALEVVEESARWIGRSLGVQVDDVH